MKRIELNGKRGKNKFTLVDAQDYDLINKTKWYLTSSGSAMSSKWNNATCKVEHTAMHRVIMKCPKDKLVDHINHNRLDNRRSNLRICSDSQNQMNKMGWSKSGYKGVSKRNDRNKFRSMIVIKYNKIHLGDFDTPIEAALAYNKKARELFGEYAKLNII